MGTRGAAAEGRIFATTGLNAAYLPRYGVAESKAFQKRFAEITLSVRVTTAEKAFEHVEEPRRPGIPLGGERRLVHWQGSGAAEFVDMSGNHPGGLAIRDPRAHGPGHAGDLRPRLAARLAGRQELDGKADRRRAELEAGRRQQCPLEGGFRVVACPSPRTEGDPPHGSGRQRLFFQKWQARGGHASRISWLKPVSDARTGTHVTASDSPSGGLGNRTGTTSRNEIMPNTRIYWLHALSPTHAGSAGASATSTCRSTATASPAGRSSAARHSRASGRIITGRRKPRQSGHARRKAVEGRVRHRRRRQLECRGMIPPTRRSSACRSVVSAGRSPGAPRRSCLTELVADAGPGREFGLPELPPPERQADDVAHHGADSGDTREAGGTDLPGRPRLHGSRMPTPTAWAARSPAWVFAGDAIPGRRVSGKRFVVLPDAAFDFLCETGTEVADPRTDRRRDQDGRRRRPWTEESLPAETILAGIVMCDRVFGRNGEDITPGRAARSVCQRPARPANRRQGDVGRGQMRAACSRR